MKKYRILTAIFIALLSVCVLFACGEPTKTEESENGSGSTTEESGGTATEEASNPSAETLTVSFDANGGTKPMASVTVVPGATYVLPDCTMVAPDGMEFKCWEIAGTRVAVGASLPVEADVTVKAVWKSILFTLSFDVNGGTKPMDAVTVVRGATYVLPNCTMVAPDGTEFWCWEIGGTEVAVGTSLTVTEDVTVKAVWKNKIFTVSFDANGGTGSMDPVLKEYKETYTLPYCTFLSDENQFLCWEIDGEGKQPSETITVLGDTVVKALWMKEKLTAQEYVSNIIKSYPFFELTEYQMPSNAKMANDEELGEVILFHEASDIETYANPLKADGFVETARSTGKVTLEIKNLDEGVRITVTIEYIPDSNAVRILVEQEVSVRYTLDDLPDNFKIGFSLYGVPWTMYRVGGDFYITDGINNNYYFRSYLDADLTPMFRVLVYRQTWCGWAAKETFKRSELYDYLVQKDWCEPLKILGYKACVNYAYDTDCTETFLDKACKKYTSYDKIGDEEYGYTDIFYTDKDSNLTLAVNNVYDGFENSNYEVYTLEIGDIVMPVFDPALDAPIAFPTEALADATDYNGFPDYPKEGIVWMYASQVDAYYDYGFDVEVYGASGDGYGDYYTALENDGFVLTFKSGDCYADKKDITNLKIYHVILSFVSGSYQEGTAGNILDLTYYVEEYVPSAWPDSITSEIPPFVTAQGEYTKLSDTVQKTDWGKSYVQVEVTDYTQAELTAWKQQLLAADAGKLWEDNENEYYLEGNKSRYLLVLTENANKSLIHIDIFSLIYRRTAPTRALEAALPEFDVPVFTFENAYYKYDFCGVHGVSQRRNEINGKYYDADTYTVVIHEKTNEGILQLTDERVAEMIAFLQEETDYVYSSYDSTFVYQSNDYVYILYCNTDGYTITVAQNVSEYYWDNDEIERKAQAVVANPEYDHLYDAIYNYSSYSNGSWSLTFETKGVLYSDYTDFCCHASGSLTQPEKIIVDEDIGNSYERFLQSKELTSSVDHGTYDTNTYKIYDIYIKYLEYNTQFYFSIEYYESTVNVDKE